MYRILIVEDDESIARSVKTHLESWNYEVCCAEDFSNVAGTFAAFDPQLVLMDVKLPFFNGYHWCSEIRKVSKVPVIFVSSASDNMNIVMAVSMGGDDFIAKPFDLEVLTAKVQAMLRRTYDFTGQSAVLEHKGAMLNLGASRQQTMAVLSVIFTVFMTGVYVGTLGTRGRHMLKTGLSLILGGAYSNTYDRLFRKYVVDYVSFEVRNPRLRNIVFNLSDFGIMIGSCLLVISQMRE